MGIPAQIGMSALVYVGYIAPAMQMHIHGVGDFPYWHSWIMMLAIPPVVSCLVTSGALISYFIYLHILEADIVSWLLRRPLQEELHRLQDSNMVKSESTRIVEWGDGNAYIGNADIVSEIYSNKVVSYLVEVFMHVQDRVDTSCKLWSVVVTQFVCVAFFEILASTYDLSLIFGGQVSYSLTVPIFCIDVFLLASGITATTAFLAMGAALTRRLDDLVVDVIIGLRSRGVPPSIAFSLYSFLETAGRKDGIGFKVFRFRITQSHVVTFFSLMSTLLAYGIAHADYMLEDDAQ